jgi:WD40 repeat protein
LGSRSEFAFSPDGRWVAQSILANQRKWISTPSKSESWVALLDRRDGKVLRLLDCYISNNHRLKFSSDNKRLLVVGVGGIQLWNVPEGKEVPLKLGKSKTNSRAFFDADNRVLTLQNSEFGAKARPPKLIDAESGETISEYKGINQLDIGSPWLPRFDGQQLFLNPSIFGTGKEVLEDAPPDLQAHVLDVRTGASTTRIHVQLPSKLSMLRLLDFHENGLVLGMKVTTDLGSGNSALKAAYRIYDTRTNSLRFELPLKVPEQANLAEFLRDGHAFFIHTGSSHIELRDSATGTLLMQWQPLGDRPIYSMLVSPDDWLAAKIAETDFVQLVDIQAMRSKLRLLGLDWPKNTTSK